MPGPRKIEAIDPSTLWPKEGDSAQDPKPV